MRRDSNRGLNQEANAPKSAPTPRGLSDELLSVQVLRQRVSSSAVLGGRRIFE